MQDAAVLTGQILQGSKKIRMPDHPQSRHLFLTLGAGCSGVSTVTSKYFVSRRLNSNTNAGFESFSRLGNVDASTRIWVLTG